MLDPSLVVVQWLETEQVTFPVGTVGVTPGGFVTSPENSWLLPPFFASEIVLDLTRMELNVSPGKSRPLHQGESLQSATAVCLSKDGVFMAIGQLEGSVALYILRHTGDSVEAQHVDRFVTNGTVALCAISSMHFLLLAVTGIRINVIDIGTRRIIAPIEPGFRMLSLQFDDYGALIIGAGYTVLGIWNVSGKLLMQTGVDCPVAAIAVPELQEVVKNRFFVTAHSNGSIKFWTVDYAAMAPVLLSTVKVGSMAIRRVAVDEAGQRVIAATADRICCLDYTGSAATPLKKKYAFICPDCNTKIAKSRGIKTLKRCSSCQRFFCLSCIGNKRRGLCQACAAHLDKASPG
jgi:hypothetical protein